MIMKAFFIALVGYCLGFAAVAITHAAGSWGRFATSDVLWEALEHGLFWPTLLAP